MLHQSHRKPRHLLVGAILTVAAAVFPAGASAASSCQTTNGSSYAINVCLDEPADGANLSGDVTVSGSASTISGTANVQRLVFYVDGQYALTDFEAPYSFTLPTDRWVDGSHRIEVTAELRDGLPATDPAGVNVTFSNGVTTLFGQFRSITNPVIGNHEYSVSPTAAGYYDYWDNIHPYYDYYANGWHFIALDSTSQGSQQMAGSDQYNWLQGVLQANQQPCTVAYWHHPPFNIGPEADATRMDEIWKLLAQYHVPIVLTGHDHDYQRWVPMDGDGNPSPDGVTEFVVGTGGHSEQTFVDTDSRVAAQFSKQQFGAMRMELNSDGAAYQFVTAAGQRLDSGSIQCSGTPTDTASPSTPANLTATAPSRGEVALSWSESKDNVGVTGYDIYRNGSLLRTIGPDSSFHDGAVAAGTTYTYTVKARDAAGNVSPDSMSATANTPSLGLLFSDGFEGSDWTTAWGKNSIVGPLTPATSPVFSGSQSAHALNTGPNSQIYISKPLAAAQPNLYLQTRVRIARQGSSPIDLMRMRAADGTPLVSIMRNASGRLQVRDEVAKTTLSGQGPPLPIDGLWHTIQLHVQINGASSQIEVWFDGTLQPNLSYTRSLGTTQIGYVDVGQFTKSSLRTFDMYYDEVGANNTQIPDVTAPSIPTS